MERKAEIGSTDASRQYTPDKVCLQHPLAPDEYFKFFFLNLADILLKKKVCMTRESNPGRLSENAYP